MTKVNLKYLSVILVILISAASCAPKIVIPQIEYKAYTELVETQPDCSVELEALTDAEHKSDQLILDTLYCYRKVWKYWENEYQIIDTQLGTLTTDEQES